MGRNYLRVTHGETRSSTEFFFDDSREIDRVKALNDAVSYAAKIEVSGDEALVSVYRPCGFDLKEVGIIGHRHLTFIMSDLKEVRMRCLSASGEELTSLKKYERNLSDELASLYQAATDRSVC